MFSANYMLTILNYILLMLQC